jgi:hypothetical protein
MRARNFVLFALLLLTVDVAARTIAFKPGEISATVKGELVADQTREYIFQGQAGQSFELSTLSDRGQHLIVHVRDKDKNDVFNNFDSGQLKTSGVLPVTGDYTVYLGLRRPEVQREGRVNYLLTLTLHPLPTLAAIEGGRGFYFVSDGSGQRTVQGVAVGLGNDNTVEIRLSLDGDGLIIKGTWKPQTDEGAVLRLTEAFGQKIQGEGIVLFDDEFNDQGKPTHILLRFEAPEQKTQHTLFFEKP